MGKRFPDEGGSLARREVAQMIILPPFHTSSTNRYPTSFSSSAEERCRKRDIVIVDGKRTITECDLSYGNLWGPSGSSLMSTTKPICECITTTERVVEGKK